MCRVNKLTFITSDAARFLHATGPDTSFSLYTPYTHARVQINGAALLSLSVHTCEQSRRTMRSFNWKFLFPNWTLRFGEETLLSRALLFSRAALEVRSQERSRKGISGLGDAPATENDKLTTRHKYCPQWRTICSRISLWSNYCSCRWTDEAIRINLWAN